MNDSPGADSSTDWNLYSPQEVVFTSHREPVWPSRHLKKGVAKCLNNFKNIVKKGLKGKQWSYSCELVVSSKHIHSLILNSF